MPSRIEKLEEALKEIIWYDGHFDWLEKLAYDMEKMEQFSCEFEVWHTEEHVIYMLLVGMFGDWGTSIRSGWINETKACAEYIRKLCNDMKKDEKYIVDYEDRHFESFWNEMCEAWSVYQAKLQDDGKYELEVHFLDNKPVATIEDAKERVENWLKLKEVVLDEVKSEVGAE